MNVTDLAGGQTWGETRAAINTNTKSLVSARLDNSIVLIGDSTVAQCDTFTSGVIEGYYDSSWWAWVQAFLDYRFDLLNMAGVGGETLAEIAARVATDVVAYSPHYCIVVGGTNNIATATTAADMAATYTSIVNELNAANIVPILFPPWASTAYNTADYRVKFYEISQWLQENASALGYYYIDQNRGHIDYDADGPYPLSGTAKPGTAYVHPNGTGAYLAGKVIAEQLAAITPNSFSYRITHKNNSRCCLSNPLMLGTSGVLSTGITGEVADGYTAKATNGTAVASKVLRSDGHGYWQAFNFASTADGGEVYLRKDAEVLPTGVAVGDVVYGVTEVSFPDDVDSADQIDAMEGFSLRYTCFDDSSTRLLDVYHMHHLQDDLSADAFKPGDRWFVKTMDFTLPTGTTKLAVYLYIYAQNGGGGMIYLGSTSIVKKSTI